jgi:hypothetical protein
MKTANENIDHTRSSISIWSLLASCIVMVAAMALTAPWAQAAPGGGGGKIPGGVKLSGTVTNSYTGLGIEGATVTLTGGGVTITMVTDANGNYNNKKVPIGAFTMTTSSPPNYPDVVQQVSLLKGFRTVDVSMTPKAKVIVSASVSGDKVPGGSLSASGSYVIMDGSAFVSFNWSQSPDEGVTATISDPSDLNPTVTLGSASDYAAHLIQLLQEPPITAADLPPDLNIQPINEINKGLQNRNQVVGVDPLALERAEAVPLKFSVTTTSGTYSASADVVTQLPWVVNTGLPTVPVNVPVLMYAKDNPQYSWTITGPNGSSATLTDADTQTPWFTPDQIGTYEIQETTGSGADLMVHVGRYQGVIDPILTLDSVNFGDKRPVGDPNCTGCHRVGGAAPANFDLWRNTGHAEAFSDGIDTNGHFGTSCFACHSVGFDRDNAGGIDNSPSYTAFLNLLSNNQASGDIADTWAEMLDQMPDTARLANIQCENCHGPQQYTDAHPYNSDGSVDSRVKLGSEVCGSCHGEPARHGRYQQWLLSNHADYDLARSRGASSGNCARCHSGNGFIAWNDLHFDPAQEVTLTWNQDTVVPQTCATCHNPHDTGTTSGSAATNAKVRIMGDTHLLLAGFMADNVGRGATCMTCHNSRASYYNPPGNLVIPVRNDSTWPLVVANNRTTDRPHHGVQADLIMGQNMYFFAPNELYPQTRGKHSLIEDTCIACHMEKTLPPDILSYNHGGTNHTFAADPNVCSQCHGSDPNADNIDAIITQDMADLKAELGAAYKRMMVAHYPVNVGSTCGAADGTTVTVTDVVWNERATRLNITLSNANSCTNRDPASITVGGGPQTLYDVSLAENDGAVLKAAWNWSMMNEDETINGCVDENDTTCTPPHTRRGVHNVDFSTKALTRATAEVKKVAP